jgi:hypothetical protein
MHNSGVRWLLHHFDSFTCFFCPRVISHGIIKAASTHVLVAMHKFCKRVEGFVVFVGSRKAKSLLGGPKK